MKRLICLTASKLKTLNDKIFLKNIIKEQSTIKGLTVCQKDIGTNLKKFPVVKAGMISATK